MHDPFIMSSPLSSPDLDPQISTMISPSVGTSRHIYNQRFHTIIQPDQPLLHPQDTFYSIFQDNHFIPDSSFLKTLVVPHSLSAVDDFAFWLQTAMITLQYFLVTTSTHFCAYIPCIPSCFKGMDTCLYSKTHLPFETQKHHHHHQQYTVFSYIITLSVSRFILNFRKNKQHPYYH